MGDGRREDRVERVVSEFLVERHPAGDGSGHRYGMNAGLRHRRHAARGQKLESRARRGPPARVKTVNAAGRDVVNDGEQIAPDAVHHRRHNPHHRIGRDRRVDHMTADPEHNGAGLCRQRIFRGHNAACRHRHRSSLPPADLRANVVGVQTGFGHRSSSGLLSQVSHCRKEFS